MGGTIRVCQMCAKEITDTPFADGICSRECTAKWFSRWPPAPPPEAVPLPHVTPPSYESNPISGDSARRLAAIEKIADSLTRTAAVQEKSWALVERFLPLVDQMLAKMQKDTEEREDR